MRPMQFCEGRVTYVSIDFIRKRDSKYLENAKSDHVINIIWFTQTITRLVIIKAPGVLSRPKSLKITSRPPARMRVTRRAFGRGSNFPEGS